MRIITNTRILTKIRKRKIGKPSDVFSCLTSEIELPKENKKNSALALAFNPDSKRTARRRRRFEALQQRWWKGKLRKLKSLRRFVKLCKELGEEIPDALKNTPIEVYQKRKAKEVFRNRRIPKKYKVYIKSKFWEKRKNKYFREHGRYCDICKSSYQTSVHHLHYKNFGYEKDEDLVSLCWFHHEDFHKKFGVKQECHKEYLKYKESCILLEKC